jgi:SAM-dependent methyltransferase
VNFPAIPEPQAVVNIHDQCDKIEVWAASTDDIAALRDADAKLAAIDAYMAHTSTEGRKRVASARLRLGARIGQLLGPAPANRGPATVSAGNGSGDGLRKVERTRLRTIAEHADVLEQVIEESSDERPPSQRQVLLRIAERKLAAAEPDGEHGDEAEAIIDVMAETSIEDRVAEAVESRRTPIAVPKRVVADDVPPHPATYPAAVIDIFRELIAPQSRVLDPFAGIGTIHQLDGIDGVRTVGIEIEPEWAAADRRTVCGDSRFGHDLFVGEMFDVIATSPAYGNRLADNYRASDPEARRSYSIDLGRSVSIGSGAGMHFGRDGEYEQLHMDVWRSVVQLLKPGGLFLLNCKDFQRDGKVVPVTGWHVGVLADLGLRAIDLRCLPAAGLPFTTAKPISEVVVVFTKDAR